MSTASVGASGKPSVGVTLNFEQGSGQAKKRRTEDKANISDSEAGGVSIESVRTSEKWSCEKII